MQYDRLTSETKLAELLKSLDKRIKSVETKGSGTIAWVDDSGVETIIGELPDGTTGILPFVNDIVPPPVASAPFASAGVGTITVAWDGFFVDNADKPADFQHLKVLGHKFSGGSYVLTAEVGMVREPLDVVYVGSDVAAIDETWDFSFISVDYNGNLSAESARSALITQTSYSTDAVISDAISSLSTGVSGAQASADGKSTNYYEATAPTNVPVGKLQKGDTWFDTANGYRVSTWTGSAWQTTQDAALAQITADSKGRTYTQDTVPPVEARLPQNLWIDTSAGPGLYVTKYWNGTAWTTVKDADAAAAQTTADAKGETIYSSTEPAAAKRLSQNLWVDTTGGLNINKRWDGSAWVVTVDSRIPSTAAAVTAVDSRVDGVETVAESKGITYTQNTVPPVEARLPQNIWIDTSLGLDKAVTKYWNGSAWTAVSEKAASDAMAVADAKGETIYSTTEPTVAQRLPQNLWVDTTGGVNIHKRWDGSGWVVTVDSRIPSTAAAVTAVDSRVDSVSAVAESKGITYTQSTTPPVSARLPQNLWNDTSLGLNFTVTKFWDPTANAGAGAWVAVSGKDAADAQAAAAADASAKAAAAINSQAYSLNPSFDDWTSTFPVGYTNWSGTPIKETSIVKRAPFAMRFNVPDTTAQHGVAWSSTMSHAPNLEFFTVEVDLYLVSGTLGGAGMILDWAGMTNNRAQMQFATELPGAVTGKWYTVSKVLRRPTNATGTWTNMSGYLMGQWSGHGTGAAKNIIFDWFNVRPSTAEEIISYGTPASITTVTDLANAKGEVIYSTTTPVAAKQLSQNLWIDTNAGVNIPKRWNGSAWVAVTDKTATDAAAAASAAQSTANTAVTNAATAQGQADTAFSIANGKNTSYYQAAQPSGGTYIQGDLWFDTDDNYKLSTYTGSAWQTTQDAIAAKTQAIDAAATDATTKANAAQTAAIAAAATDATNKVATKNATYYQTAMPTGGTYKVGDLWFDTDDGNKIYAYNGTTFVSAQDAAIAAAQGTANTALTSANGKNKVYYQTAMPTGGTYILGDTWFDTDDGNKIYVHNGTTFVASQDASIATAQTAANNAQTTANTAVTTANSKTKTYFQTAQPGTSGNTTGDIWFDTDDGNKVYVWNGSAWTVAQDAAISAAQTSANGKATIFYQTSAPSTTGRVTGDTWFDTDDGNKIYVWNGSAWTASQDAAIAAAQSTANSKVKTFVQGTSPTATTTGDIWIDTASGNAIKVWDGSAWVNRADTAIAAAQGTANSALTSANGKNKIYYQTTMPSGGTYIAGDTWFDTDDGNKIYVHNGTTFTASQLGTNAIANLAITDAQIAGATITNAKIANLDAAKITTGTLDANRIGANTIAANKIFVGDLTNLAADGNFTDTTKANWVGSGTVTVSANEPNRLRVVAAASGNNDQYSTNTFQVTAGEQIYGEVWVYGEPANVGAGGPNMHLVCTSNAGVSSWPAFQSLTRAGVSGAWTLLKGTVTIPANTKTAKVELAVSYSADAVGNIYYFREVSVRRKATGNLIVDGAIQAGSAIIATGAIGTAQIGDAQITTAKIANLAVTDAQIATATITSAKIANLDAAKITTGTLDANRIGADTITASHIASDAITANELAANSITAAKGQISDAAITTAKIADAQITTAKIANLAVTDAQIATATITSAKIANLDAAKITTGTLDANRIGANSLTANKIAVTDFNNLFDNGRFDLGTDGLSGWNSGAGVVVSDANAASGKALRIAGITGSYPSHYQSRDIPCAPGEKIRVKGMVMRSATGNSVPSVRTMFLNSAKAMVANSGIGVAAPAVDTWGPLNGVTTAPAGTAYVRLWVEYSGLTGSYGYVTDLEAYRMNAGELIVDGTITAGSAIIADAAIGNAKIADLNADKLTAGTVNAARLNAEDIRAKVIAATDINAVDIIAQGSLTSASGVFGTMDASVINAGTLAAGRIGAGTIDVSKLNVTMGGLNLIANSSFEVDSDANGLADGWTVSARGSGDAGRVFTNSRVAGHFPGSTWAQKVVTTTATNTNQSSLQGTQLFPVAPGVKVTVSLYARADSAQNFTIGMRCEDDAAAYIGEPTFVAALTTTAQRFSGTLTIPAGTTKAKFTITGPTSPANGSWFEADGVKVEIGDVVSAWSPMTQELLPGTILANMISATAIDGKTITGATVQTETTANRGIKLTSAELAGYDGAGVKNLSLTSAGVLTLKGAIESGSTITGATVSGGTVTGSTVQTETTANRGIKLTSTELAGYDGAGVKNFSLTSGGTLALKGAIQSGSTITGATLTGAGIETTVTAARGVKIASTGITTYDGSGNMTFKVDASTGLVEAPGLKANSITGDKIASQTITANNIMVGDFNNLATIDELNGITVTNFGQTQIVGGYNTLVADGGSFFMFNDKRGPIPFKTGDEVYFEFTAKANAATNVSFGIWTYDAAQSNASTVTPVNLPVGTTDTFVSGKLVMTSVIANAKQFVAGLSSVANKGLQIKNVKVYKKHGGTLIVDGAINGHTITGATIQTETTANRGIKLTSTELAGYDGAGVKNFSLTSAGALTLKGDIQSGSTITGARLIGAGIETSATASSGVKIASTGITAYDAGNNLTFKVDAATGLVEAPGLKANTITSTMISATAIDGKTITGAVIQTEATTDRGIKLTSTELSGYDGAGIKNLSLTSAGALTLRGEIKSGSTIEGARITGTQGLETSTVANTGVKINNAGIKAYDGANNLTFSVDAATGLVKTPGLEANSIKGDMIASSTISTKNMLVGDFTNLVENPSFETNDLKGWVVSGGWYTNNAAPQDGTYKALTQYTGSEQYLINNAQIYLKAGEKVRVKVFVYPDAPTSGTTFNISLSNSVGGATESVTAPTMTNGSWNEYSVILTAETTGNKQLRLATLGTGSGYVRIDNVRMYKMGTGELIVDGAITTTHMTSGTIDAGVITSGSIKALQIGSKEITSDKLVITSTDNVVPEADFSANLVQWGGISGAWSVDATGSRSASTALKVVNDATQQTRYNTNSIPVEAGSAYRVSCWVKSSVTIPTAGIGLKVRTTDTAGAQTITIVTSNSASASAASTWYKLAVTYTIPAGAVKAEFGLYTENTLSTGNAWFDTYSATRAGDGTLIVDGAIDGKTITGSTIQTETTALRGLKLTSAGLYAYSSTGVNTFSLSASTGKAVLTGRILSGATGEAGLGIIPAAESYNGTQAGIFITTDGSFPGGIGGMWVNDATTGVAERLQLRGHNYGDVEIAGQNLHVRSGGGRVGNFSNWALGDAGNGFNYLPNLLVAPASGTGYLKLANAPTSSSAANAIIAVTPEGVMYRSTSSIKYKADVQDWAPDYRAIGLRPRSWVDRNPIDPAAPLDRYYGYIAEEVAEIMPEFVTYDEFGDPESVTYDRMPSPATIAILKDIVRRLDAAGI